jgi:murein endopeptidase
LPAVVAALVGVAVAGSAVQGCRPVSGEHASADRPPLERPAKPQPQRSPEERIRWRRSVAVGSPIAGRLVRGVQLPARGGHFATWDPILRRSPNRGWRRWGTDRLVRLLLALAREYRAVHPAARPLLVGDLSRPHGGDFGPQFGYIGHASHQNGLDADIYYPRRDRTPKPPRTAAEIDRRLSQDLVDRLLAVGAVRVLVGPETGLRGPPSLVRAVPNHDNHLHVRIR